jgi:hypothetical protein
MFEFVRFLLSVGYCNQFISVQKGLHLAADYGMLSIGYCDSIYLDLQFTN